MALGHWRSSTRRKRSAGSVPTTAVITCFTCRRIRESLPWRSGPWPICSVRPPWTPSGHPITSFSPSPLLSTRWSISATRVVAAGRQRRPGTHRRLAGVSVAQGGGRCARGAFPGHAGTDAGARSRLGGPTVGRGLPRAVGQGSAHAEPGRLPASRLHRPCGAAHSKPARRSGPVGVASGSSGAASGTDRGRAGSERSSTRSRRRSRVSLTRPAPPSGARSAPGAPVPPPARCRAVPAGRGPRCDADAVSRGRSRPGSGGPR